VSRTVKIVISVVVLAVLVAAAAFFLSKSAGSGPVIKTAKASNSTLKVTVAASGKISAGERSEVYPPAPGTLAVVYVKDGQTVKAGQKLAKMDTGPLKMAVKQAEAGVEQAESGLATLDQSTPSHLDERAAAAAVRAADAQYDNAKMAYDFTKSLPSAPSKETSVAIANAGVKQAKAGLLSAKAALLKVRRGQDVGEQRGAANAGIASAQAALDVAKANLNGAVLVAPIDGTVFLNPAGIAGADGKAPLPAAGAGVAPAAAPFSVVSLGTSTFTAEVDEADIDRVKLGMIADVTLDAFPGTTLKTTVVHINPAAQPTATGGTIFQVELALTDTGKTILLGMKGDATIQVSAVQGALTIPVEALFNQNGQNYVFKLVGAKLVQTNITVGATTDTSVEVLKGLSAGDTVALAGSTQYTDGMTVRAQ
jgi:HlyD family secretion protein